MTRYRRRRRRGRWSGRDIALAGVAGLVLAGLVHASVPGAAAPAPGTQVLTSVSGNAALGQRIAAGYGWGSGAEWTCLDELWVRESGWSNTAENPKSGAYGIAQALGHGPTNQYPAGPANPPQSDAATQIRWGLGYIETTYTTPCGAWGHEETDGWY
jgi:hypothetical protein